MFAEVFVLFASSAIMTLWAYDTFTEKSKNRKRKNSQRKVISEAIIFSGEGAVVKTSKYSRYPITESMERLLYFMNSPRYTMDVCMYGLLDSDLANVLLKLHFRHVKIRIIVDANFTFSSSKKTYLLKLMNQGIPVRFLQSTNLMHHKFSLIDAAVKGTDAAKVTPVVMLGSLNWTDQALKRNLEDVMVTSKEEIVRQFKKEFERLWVLFDPFINLN